MGAIYSQREQQIVEDELKKYSLHGRYNQETQKPYIEIKKGGKHYCYAPWSLFKDNVKIGDMTDGNS